MSGEETYGMLAELGFLEDLQRFRDRGTDGFILEGRFLCLVSVSLEKVRLLEFATEGHALAAARTLAGEGVH